MGLEAEFRNAIFCEQGEWEIEGKQYPFVVLYGGERNVRLSLDREATIPEGLDFGDKVDAWISLEAQTKRVGDRNTDILKGKILHLQRSRGVVENVEPYTAVEAAA